MKSVAVVLLVAACTHNRPLRDAYEVTGDVTIETFDHRELEATAVETPTGTVFRTAGGEIYEPGSVAKVTDERTLRGAAEGFGIGAGIGILGGAVLGYADGDDGPCTDHGPCILQMTRGEKAVFFGGLFGLLTGVVGLAVGAVRGSQFEYEGGDPPVIRPVGPPGSVAGLTFSF